VYVMEREDEIMIEELIARRDSILKEMGSIRSMKRGTITEQYLKVRHEGQSEPVLRGPYYLFSRKENKRTVGKRLTSAAELAQARADVAAHKRFVQLCREFEELTERLGELERELPDDEAQKKTPRLRSRGTRK